MFNFVQNIWLDLHPMIVHFALAGLFLSFGFTLLARIWTNAAFIETSWVLLVVGVVAAVPAVITGFLAHLPYEGNPTGKVAASDTDMTGTRIDVEDIADFLLSLLHSHDWDRKAPIVSLQNHNNRT